MFWKKDRTDRKLLRAEWLEVFRKKTKPDTEMFHFNTRERRKWFRIQPSDAEPILLRIEDKEIHIRDIGAAGLSFRNDDLSPGLLEFTLLDLPETGPAIPIRLNILTIDRQNVCHCEFTAVEDGAVERIHQYVLRRQKEILRAQKENAQKAEQPIRPAEADPNG